MIPDHDNYDRLWAYDDDNNTAVIMPQKQQHTDANKIPQDINEEKSNQVSLDDIITLIPNDRSCNDEMIIMLVMLLMHCSFNNMQMNQGFNRI